MYYTKFLYTDIDTKKIQSYHTHTHTFIPKKLEHNLYAQHDITYLIPLKHIL